MFSKVCGGSNCTKLKNLLNNEDYREFHEVISYMIENNVTLEQEDLDID